MILYADKEINKLVVDMDKSFKSEEYPDYTPEIMDLGLPPWMTNPKEKQPQHEDIELY